MTPQDQISHVLWIGGWKNRWFKSQNLSIDIFEKNHESQVYQISMGAWHRMLWQFSCQMATIIKQIHAKAKPSLNLLWLPACQSLWYPEHGHSSWILLALWHGQSWWRFLTDRPQWSGEPVNVKNKNNQS